MTLHTSCIVEKGIVTLAEVPKSAEALLLKGNQLHIETLYRQNLSNIQYIDISSNQLKLHQAEALLRLFSQLQSIRALDLSNNHLESLQSGIFDGLKSLEFLSLSGNSIVYIERNTFQALTSLRALNLNDNQLQTIDENWFSNISLSIRELDLRSNNIDSIDNGDLMHLVKLEKLILTSNRLAYINEEAFTDSEIQELYLNNNRLKSVPKEALLQLSKLVILSMDNNPIVNLYENSIPSHVNLKKLSLCNMPKLRIVHRHAFTNMPELLQINLFQNPRLEYIHPESFSNCESVETLHVHSNSLRGLDESILTSLPALKELSIYNNKIHCSCLADWLRNTTFHMLDGDKIVCASPHSVKMATLYQLTDSQLNLECSPLVLLQSSLTVSAHFGTDIALECQALGCTTLQWSRSRLHPKIINQSNQSREESNGRLQIKMVQHSDEGSYTCLATSPSGESDSASVYVRVVHSIITFTTLAVSKSFMVLQWDNTKGPTVLTYADDRGNRSEVNIAAGINQYTLDKLKADTGYVVCLLYHNKLEHSCITVHMLPESRSDIVSAHNSNTGSTKSTSRHKASQAILIVFAAIGMLVISILVIAVVYKKCRRYKNTKILYVRQNNDSNLGAESTEQVKLDHCYNPTTVPLCRNELT